ncbi:MAG: phage baseplate assembly protein V [Erythrobacter sp.]|nr:phage baseplate assembly protein V [Erythrobacter sp.]
MKPGLFYPGISQASGEPRGSEGLGGLWHGVAPAKVVSLTDPDGQGRVQIELPWSPDPDSERYLAWARMATLFAGANRGSWFLPDVGDEVLVAFEQGSPRRPYILGGLWNGQDNPPDAEHSDENNKKVIRSRNGVKVTMDDSSGQEKLQLETPGGQKVNLTDGPGEILVEDSNGNSIKLDPSGVTVTASALVKVEASMVQIDATAVTVNAATSTFSGVVNAQTVIASSVVSASYTPGAGNIW